jgi:hypothetical protein
MVLTFLNKPLKPYFGTLLNCFNFRYSKEDDMDDMERDLGDEYGWKQVRLFVTLVSPSRFNYGVVFETWITGVGLCYGEQDEQS